MEFSSVLVSAFRFLFDRRLFRWLVFGRLGRLILVGGIIGPLYFLNEISSIEPAPHHAFEDFQIAAAQGQQEKAIEAGERALSLSRELTDYNAVYVGQIEQKLAVAYQSTSNVQRAIELLNSSLTNFQGGGGPCEPLNMIARNHHFESLMMIGEFELARGAWNAAFRSYIDVLDFVGPDIYQWEPGNEIVRNRVYEAFLPFLNTLENRPLTYWGEQTEFVRSVLKLSAFFSGSDFDDEALRLTSLTAMKLIGEGLVNDLAILRLLLEASALQLFEGEIGEAITFADQALVVAQDALASDNDKWFLVYAALIEAHALDEDRGQLDGWIKDASDALPPQGPLAGPAEQLVQVLAQSFRANQDSNALADLMANYPKTLENQGRGTPSSFESRDGNVAIDLLYGTTRQRVLDSDRTSLLGYSAERTTTESDRGHVEVSIPLCHQRGEFEGIGRLHSFHVAPNPLEHIVMHRPHILSADDFSEALRSKLKAAGEKEILVYIHGFNVRFEEAARRTAQLAHDLEFDGVSAFYSWPSRGEVTGYTMDSNISQFVVDDLDDFLTEITRETGAESVNLIVHSLGSTYLFQSLKQMANRSGNENFKPFREVVLAAPDIDVDNFRRLVPQISHLWRRATVYASSKDWTMMLSDVVNGYPRVGAARPMVLVDGVQSIDASAANTGLTGHSYYSNDLSIMTDIRALIWHSLEPSERCFLTAEQSGDSAYWRYSPTLCSAPTFDLASVLAHRYGREEALSILDQPGALKAHSIDVSNLKVENVKKLLTDLF